MTPGVPSRCRLHAYLLALCCAAVVSPCSAQTLLQTVFGEAGAENYTYYRISRPGTLALRLQSIDGDVDIFISERTLKPSFSDYDAQSVTCGLDVVEIPFKFSRPVGVAVYGSYIYDLSHYKLEIFLISDEEGDTYEYLSGGPYQADFDQSGIDYETYATQSRVHTSSDRASKEGEIDDSPWWTLLVDILKIVFEVIV